MMGREWRCSECGSHKLSPGPYMNGKYWCYACRQQMRPVSAPSEPEEA